MANGAPEISPEILAERARYGQSLQQRQMSGTPRFANPNVAGSTGARNMLFQTLLGIGPGLQAASQTANLGSPLISALAGASAAFGAPRVQDFEAQLAAKRAEAELQAFEASPIETVSPILAERFPELKGVPLGVVNKISPLLSQMDRLQRDLVLIKARAEARGSGQLSDRALQILSKTSGRPVDELRGLTGIEAQRLGLLPRALTQGQEQTLQNISQGAGDLRVAIDMFRAADPETRKLSAISGIGGSAARGLTGNEDAQEIARLVGNAADVLTRQRTGAALNAYEERYYRDLLNDWKRSDGQNIKALEDFLEFYEKVQSEIELGQRGAGTRLLAKGQQQAQPNANPAPSGQPISAGLASEAQRILAERRKRKGAK